MNSKTKFFFPSIESIFCCNTWSKKKVKPGQSLSVIIHIKVSFSTPSQDILSVLRLTVILTFVGVVFHQGTWLFVKSVSQHPRKNLTDNKFVIEDYREVNE